MHTPSPELYLEVLTRLTEAFNGQNYFSGIIAFSFTETQGSADQQPQKIDCRLRASVIAYTHKEEQASGQKDVIYNLIPVWWEFHTTNNDGEFINDFSFNELKEYL